jgi:8-oxo-dGTP pyrophosphatase MutT (NUDIX family)
MSENKLFNVGIKGVIVKDNKVLVLRANAAKERRDIWEMPGGRINDNETIEQALKRELKEEVPNIKNIKMHELLDVYRLPWDIGNDISLMLIFYSVTADFDGDPQISDEHVDWKWATKEEALKLVTDNCMLSIKKLLK